MWRMAQHKHVLDMYRYAVEVAQDYGVQIAMETDISLEDHFRFLDQFDGKLKLCLIPTTRSCTAPVILPT